MAERALSELLYGQGAHADTLACVAEVPPALAGRRPDHSPHSIWQLVYHMNYWMDYELKRIRGEKPAYPEHASESWPVNAAPETAEEWQNTIARFGELLEELARLAESPPEILAEEVAATHSSH